MFCLEGYVLCFAPIVMKMLRINYIFHNPFNSAKKVSGIVIFLACTSHNYTVGKDTEI